MRVQRKQESSLDPMDRLKLLEELLVTQKEFMAGTLEQILEASTPSIYNSITIVP